MAYDDKFFCKPFFIQLTLPRQKNKTLQIVCCLLLHLPLLPLFAQEEFIELPSVESFQDLPLDSSFTWIENYQYQDSKTYNFKAHEICLQALNSAYLTEDDATIAKAHRLLRDWHDATKVFTFDSIIYHDLKAIEYYQKINDLQKVAQLNNILARDYLAKSEFKKGEEALFHATIPHHSLYIPFPKLSSRLVPKQLHVS